MGKIRYAYSPSLGKRIAVEEYVPPNQRQAPARDKKRKPFEVEWFKYPACWIEVLRNASAGAHLLASIVLAENFRQEQIGGDIVLSAVVTKMSQTTRRRAVRELVELGLISVKQVGNGAPTVTAIYRRPAGRK
jgi:hypothetical protein